jgi:hypothetical protein
MSVRYRRSEDDEWERQKESPAPLDMNAEVRKTVGRARTLAALKASDLAAHTGSDPADVLGAYAAAFGEARVLLRALADIADRLSGEDPAERRRAWRAGLRETGGDGG